MKNNWFLQKNSNKQFNKVISSEDAFSIIKNIAKKYGYKIYLVGGSVRDLIIGKKPKDYDFIVIKDDEAEKSAVNFVKHIAEDYNIKDYVLFEEFGVGKIKINNIEYEFIIPRKESYIDSSRKPKIKYGTLEDDALRRDFTVNALYMDIFTNEIIDPTGKGLEDIKNKIIRTVDIDNPDRVFYEDPLRMLRAIRQSLSLGFELDPKIKESIKRNINRLDIVSMERIRDEFAKILQLPKASKAIKLMEETGLLDKILPELKETIGVKQNEEYHLEDVYEHILNAIDNSNLELTDRLVALLHDISKPATKKIIDNIVTFYDHENVSAEMAKKILERLKFPNHIIEEVYKRVKHHLVPHLYTKEWGDAKIRRLINELGDLIYKIIEFAKVDIDSSISKKEKDYSKLHELKDRIEKQKELAEKAKKFKDIINGNDLIKEFGIQEGPFIGELLKYAKELIEENPNITKEDILNKISEKYNLKRKSSFNIVSYITYIKNHKNSKGEPAPWVIKSHKDGHIISSHKTRKEAEKHLKRIRYFKYKKSSLNCYNSNNWFINETKIN